MTTYNSNSNSVSMINSLIIVRDLMLKHLKKPRTSKKNHFKFKKYSDVNTENICNYIKPSIVKKPDFSVVHSGTNDLTNRISTMTKILEVLERPILAFLHLLIRVTLTKWMR